LATNGLGNILGYISPNIWATFWAIFSQSHPVTLSVCLTCSQIFFAFFFFSAKTAIFALSNKQPSKKGSSLRI
jgi:hypothetical protein